MSEEKKRGPVIDDAELKEHHEQSAAWAYKISSQRFHAARNGTLNESTLGLSRLIETYERAIDAFYVLRTRFPGRLTAASNAIRSLEASIRGLWFELEGDEFSPKPERA